MENYLLDIGKRIKKIRKEKQLIISQVADKAGGKQWLNIQN